jgi:hypothetical protein
MHAKPEMCMESYLEIIRGNLDANGVAESRRLESFDDFVAMKAIGAKRIQTFGNAFGANASPVGMGSHSKELVRNLCVRLDALSLAEIDALTDALECSKQEFVVELLAAGIAKTMAALEQQGLSSVFEERMGERLKKAELSFQPTADGKYRHLCFRGEVIRAKDWKRHETPDEPASER